MSIKIYDGLIGMHDDVWELSNHMRRVLDREFVKKYAALVNYAKRAMEEKELRTLGEIFGEGQGDEELKSYNLASQVYAMAVRNPDSFLSQRLCIAYTAILLPNAMGAPLVLVQHENLDYTQTLIGAEIVQPYGYWDNADPEEGLTDYEWNEREQAWSCIFKKPPAEVGLIIRPPGSITAQVSLQ